MTLIEHGFFRRHAEEREHRLGEAFHELRTGCCGVGLQRRIEQHVAAQMLGRCGHRQNDRHIARDQRRDGGREQSQALRRKIAEQSELKGKRRVRQHMAIVLRRVAFQFDVNVGQVGPPGIVELRQLTPGAEVAAACLRTHLVDRAAHLGPPVRAKHAGRFLEIRVQDDGLCATGVAGAAFAVRDEL